MLVKENAGPSHPRLEGMHHTQTMKPPKASLGGRVLTLRRAQKMTQEDLAAATGVSRGHLSHIERDTDATGRASLQALAAYFGVSIEYLLTGEQAPASHSLEGQANDADELTFLRFWRGMNDDERFKMLRHLMSDKMRGTGTR